ncbi:MAG: putative deoxycytidine triphosphate deaminase [Candidatus Moranbacteria bacterium GW2011_GWD2_36_12]|nr:MAG: putative deoxycytidine triphosphate deaminase [Candidatus Moranbacteria bacterium GW2011_GWD2_36_12]
MFFSHKTIEECIDNGRIIIGPDFDKKNIRPVGIRIHLGDELLVPEPDQIVNLTEANDLKYKSVDISKEEFYLEPGQFVLGSTLETIKTATNILTILDGRSTIARLGLTTHITASIIDGTFEIPHSATLEIKNVGNFKIRLKFRDPIAMMLFAELKDHVTQQLQSQYRSAADRVAPPNLNYKTGEDK